MHVGLFWVEGCSMKRHKVRTKTGTLFTAGDAVLLLLVVSGLAMQIGDPRLWLANRAMQGVPLRFWE
jgi:hypothetical protein